jgi:hypothetical protein
MPLDVVFPSLSKPQMEEALNIRSTMCASFKGFLGKEVSLGEAQRGGDQLHRRCFERHEFAPSILGWKRNGTERILSREQSRNQRKFGSKGSGTERKAGQKGSGTGWESAGMGSGKEWEALRKSIVSERENKREAG